MKTAPCIRMRIPTLGILLLRVEVRHTLSGGGGGQGVNCMGHQGIRPPSHADPNGRRQKPKRTPGLLSPCPVEDEPVPVWEPGVGDEWVIHSSDAGGGGVGKGLLSAATKVDVYISP